MLMMFFGRHNFNVGIISFIATQFSSLKWIIFIIFQCWWWLYEIKTFKNDSLAHFFLIKMKTKAHTTPHSKYENYCSTIVKIPRDFLAKNAIYSRMRDSRFRTSDHCETRSRFHLAISTQARTRSWPKIDHPSSKAT